MSSKKYEKNSEKDTKHVQANLINLITQITQIDKQCIFFLIHFKALK